MICMSFKKAWALVQDNKCITACCVAVGAAGGVAAVPAVVTGPLLSALGFAAGGVVKGSLAAAWHSVIGNAVAPSIFATLQSAGMVGYGAPVVAGAVSTAASGTAVAIIAVCAKVCGATGVVRNLTSKAIAKL
ncbi:hypothetical protein Sste5346_007370 [Sporothrix stenoceras]|uniref:Interferon-induced 6-16 n=1 Tax=Sporothrix stenoceras TaxID=5173 RepID=A0ABR3YUP8_9PEZI